MDPYALEDVRPFLLARHIETSKNAQRRHGWTDGATPTPIGLKQLSSLVSETLKFGAKRVLATQTPQCQATAQLLSHRTGIPVIDSSLKPFDMGRFAGLSEHELRRLDPATAIDLELFRYGERSFIDCDSRFGETATELDARLTAWTSSQGRQFLERSVVLASSSVLTLLVNACLGVSPREARYRNVPFAPGSALAVNPGAAPDIAVAVDRIWPRTTTNRIACEYGTIVTTLYYPVVSSQADTCALVIPGAFGSNRFGPYGAYGRLASELARDGIATCLLDPIGSGESTPLARSLATELMSARSALDELLSQFKNVVLIGHSTGASIASAVADEHSLLVILLAPLVDPLDTLGRMGVAIGTFAEGETVTRRGITVASDMFLELPQPDTCISNGRPAVAIVAADDPYVPLADSISSLAAVRLFTIDGADHNFSSNLASANMIRTVREQLAGKLFDGEEADQRLP